MKDKISEMYTQAEEDLGLLECSGPSAFESEEEFESTVENQFGAVYALTESLTNR